MSRILFAWELGANFGHIAQFRPLARKLKSLGHDVRFALRDVTWARAFLGNEGFPCYQAPIWASKPSHAGEKTLRSYADILVRLGWTDSTALGGALQAWRSLYELFCPDVLVASHAPTALLAATGMGIRTIRLGTGFECPPLTTPLPSMRDWAPSPEEDLLRTEAALLESVRRVLADFRTPASAESLRDAIQADEDLLCTFPELDHYPNRKNANYVGPLFVDDEGVEPEWPEGNGGRVFAYLRANYRALPALLDGLRQSSRPVFAVIPGLKPDLVRSNESTTLRISTRPARMRSVAAKCELAVCHGGHGTVSAMLIGGVPLILLPEHLEQLLLARRVEAFGVTTLAPNSNQDQFRSAIARTLRSDLTTRAIEFKRSQVRSLGIEQLEALAAALDVRNRQDKLTIVGHKR